MFFMDRRLKRWECALLVGVLCAVIWGCWADHTQQELAGRLIRLHVIANSDSQEDQALKLRVRDRVLEEAQAFYPQNATLEEARAALEGHLSQLAQAGQAQVAAEGYSYPVTASLEKCWFPTKEYEGFALPAGEYTALRIVIGEGGGQNWWCVVFPPLCLGSVSETTAETAASAGFSEDEISLITGENEGYVVKFKAMELWDRFCAWVENR